MRQPLRSAPLRRLPTAPRHALGALALACAATLASAAPADDALRLEPSTALSPPPRGDAARQRPIILRADHLRARPDLDALAEGAVEFRRAGTVIRADRLSYDAADDLAIAHGHVEISRDGQRYRGPELQLRVQRFEGFFLQPEFEFEQLGAGGRAERIDFLDAARARALQARYTGCPRDAYADPDWVLRTERIKLDFETNEGVAEGAVLQFLGVPILGLPVLSFPLSEDRKSGWLPPTVVPLDSRSGFTIGVPYYWNIAPNRDATLTPTVMARRGLMADLEFRYLEPRDGGRLALSLLPGDRVAGRDRLGWQFEHEGRFGGAADGWRYRATMRHVSDDDYWKDFPRAMPGTTPRLLPLDLRADRGWATPLGPAEVYARVQQWQVLQTADLSSAIVAPYARSPQLGLRLTPAAVAGWVPTLETEFNHFVRPDGSASAALPTGWRWHALGQLSRRWGDAGWWLQPRLSVNAASYHTDQALADGRRQAARTIPTASVDAGLVFERDSHWFGRAQRQTLEPRLLYVNTPYRAQDGLPNFDAAGRDFNAISVYGENAFSGIDRVADAHQLTAGLTTRLIDAASGAETLRLGVAQRFLFRDQRVTPDGQAITQRVSDLLLEGSSTLLQPWRLDAALQYNPDSRRLVRSILGARYAPAPFQTLSVGYRLARGLSEQLELGWQWPVYRGDAKPLGAAQGCGGTLYAVGRVNYSMRDSRVTDSLAGFEYDAGCWIVRVIGERLSTGRSEASTRMLLQLELVGLSRLGANPLQVLKDNIPGYRLLRDERAVPSLVNHD